eukprot:4022491-Pleurochrysis_carterae.AAC.1
MAKREDRPRDTGDLNTKLPPCLFAADATRTQLLTMAFARMTVAGSPPSYCAGCAGIPILDRN